MQIRLFLISLDNDISLVIDQVRMNTFVRQQIRALLINIDEKVVKRVVYDDVTKWA
jgi:hypothetical protein